MSCIIFRKLCPHLIEKTIMKKHQIQKELKDTQSKFDVLLQMNNCVGVCDNILYAGVFISVRLLNNKF